tara:strand:+ start:866 stop:1432 length:567 start_codon:yes stop_codon:yes gene_type:complete
MEEVFQKVLSECEKISCLNKNVYRPNVSGIEKVKQFGNDVKFGHIRKLGFPCESITFGTQKIRFKKRTEMYQPSRWNKKFPDLYDALLELATYIIPDDFIFNGEMNITLNKNLKCLPHHDQNKGDSIIMGFGDYEGGRLILHHKDNNNTTCDNEYVDIKYKPFKFNGKNILHSTENFKGNRYSVIYFT